MGKPPGFAQLLSWSKVRQIYWSLLSQAFSHLPPGQYITEWHLLITQALPGSTWRVTVNPPTRHPPIGTPESDGLATQTERHTHPHHPLLVWKLGLHKTAQRHRRPMACNHSFVYNARIFYYLYPSLNNKLVFFFMGERQEAHK